MSAFKTPGAKPGRSGKMIGYPPDIPDLAHGGRKLTGNPSAKSIMPKIKKPK